VKKIRSSATSKKTQIKDFSFAEVNLMILLGSPQIMLKENSLEIVIGFVKDM
jgi:hypothetical protein